MMVQGSLFDGGDVVGPLPLRPAVQRTQLGNGAWIDVRPGWMSGSGVLFDRLLGSVPWRADRRRMYDRTVDVPRLVSFYDRGDPLPDPALDLAREVLTEAYQDDQGLPLSTTGVCLYRDGRDSVAWHGDTIGRNTTRDTLVAILSLGEPRRFLLRPKGGGRSERFALGQGDLLVMGGSCQRTWEHSVPKTAAGVGPRISVQFRSEGVR